MDTDNRNEFACCSPPALCISLEELEAQITELAGHLNAANYRWLSLIAEFDRRRGWADGKLPSCAHWLNFKCGLNLGAAREKVRVGHALAALPKIAASMARGELSYSKVRALTRVACAATEDTLLMYALHGTAFHVERVVSGCPLSREREPLDVGRKTRSIPAAIRRALNSRDNGCRFPGCTHQRYVDAHHIEHWADGGETKLANLVTLCRLHRRLVHEGEISVETLSDGTWRFLRPDGSHYEVVPVSPAPTSDGEELRHAHSELDIRIDNNTAATRWRGERMDYELGVWVLCNQANRERNTGGGDCDVPAGTSDAARQPEEDRSENDPAHYNMEDADGGEWWRPGTAAYADLHSRYSAAKC
jgi:hypothetical protein